MNKVFCTSLADALITAQRAMGHMLEVSLENHSGLEDGYLVIFDGAGLMDNAEFQFVTAYANSVEVAAWNE
jgi:hypothetical protein